MSKRIRAGAGASVMLAMLLQVGSAAASVPPAGTAGAATEGLSPSSGRAGPAPSQATILSPPPAPPSGVVTRAVQSVRSLSIRGLGVNLGHTGRDNSPSPTTTSCQFSVNLSTYGTYTSGFGFVDEGVLTDSDSNYSSSINCDGPIGEAFTQTFIDVDNSSRDVNAADECYTGACTAVNANGIYVCQESSGLNCQGTYTALGTFMIYSFDQTFLNPDPAECGLRNQDHSLSCSLTTAPPIVVNSTYPPGVVYG